MTAPRFTADMRFLTSIFAIVVGIVATPLLLLMMPSITFRVYLGSLPVYFDHPHVQASLASLWDVYVATLCIIPPFSSLAFLCPVLGDETHETSHTSLHGLLLHRPVLLIEKAAQLAPTAQAISSIWLLAEGMIPDNLGGLYEEQTPRAVAGDCPAALTEVSQTSGDVARALYRLLIQIELGICR